MPLPSDAEPGIQPPPKADAHAKSLGAFLHRNRVELVARCQQKVNRRRAPLAPPRAIDPGVPRFLQQLEEVLDAEQQGGTHLERSSQPTPSKLEIGQAAARHGAVLLQQGFSVDQVVHEYGDICQAVTELALAQDAPFTTDEFRILNRCLDNAIAGAVAAYQGGAEQSRVDEAAGRARATAHADPRMPAADIHCAAQFLGDQGGSGGHHRRHRIAVGTLVRPIVAALRGTLAAGGKCLAANKRLTPWEQR